jgi:2-dehydropantoate 2-reductase
MGEAGHEVTLVGRPAHMEAIAADGLRIAGIWGDHHIKSLKGRTDVDGLCAGEFDLILIAVKSYDTADAVESIRSLVDGDTLVCAYQNGLGNAETIAAAFGWDRTIGVRAIFGTRITAPGHAEVTVIASPTTLGVYRDAAPAARVREIASAMNEAGLPTVYTDDISTVLWGKVAYNSALNPLSALLDVPYGALLNSDHTLALMTDVVRELYAVAAAMDVSLRPDTPEGYMKHFTEDLVPPTAAHYGSMREDFMRGRPTEIDALNGAIARFGVDHDVPCPANALLTRLVHGREDLKH